MLINFSNHPSSSWPTEQKNAAAVYGQIIDLPFPYIDPEEDELYINQIAENYIRKINEMQNNTKDKLVVHVMGELTFVYTFVNALKKNGIICIASTTERISKEENGIKISKFQFKRFRKY